MYQVILLYTKKLNINMYQVSTRCLLRRIDAALLWCMLYLRRRLDPERRQEEKACYTLTLLVAVFVSRAW